MDETVCPGCAKELEALRKQVEFQKREHIEMQKYTLQLEAKVAELTQAHELNHDRYNTLHMTYTEAYNQLAAMTKELDEWRDGTRQYPPAVQDYKDLCVELKRVQFDLAVMTQDRNEYKAGFIGAGQMLATAQARIKALCDALVSIQEQGWLSDAQRVAREALTTPDDSSALDAVLKPRGWWNPKYPTLAVQLTKPHDGGGWEPFYTAPEKVTSPESQLL